MLAMFFSSFAFAQSGLSSEEIESRSRKIGESIRCVVCQNQSIEESDASLAKDMRILIRERVTTGESDAEVIEFMRKRYGDYVLLKPPLQRNTLVLWFLPFLILFAMVVWLLKTVRGPKRSIEFKDDLSEEERNALDKILDTPK